MWRLARYMAGNFLRQRVDTLMRNAKKPLVSLHENELDSPFLEIELGEGFLEFFNFKKKKYTYQVHQPRLFGF